MIPNYKTSCRKIILDIERDTYQSFYDKFGNICPFCEGFIRPGYYWVECNRCLYSFNFPSGYAFDRAQCWDNKTKRIEVFVDREALKEHKFIDLQSLLNRMNIDLMLQTNRQRLNYCNI